jgi:phospholipid/cholesterol/gamma-HCH transport system substrate-binding protein
VSRFVHEAGRTAEITASRRDDLQESFRRLPAFLAELEPYMGRLSDLTVAQTPVLRNLQSASGELDTFLTRLRPFAAEGLPAFKALGDMSVVGRRAVRKTTEEVRELRRLAKDAPAFAKPLRQFLQTIDDRKRAVEPDSRAAATGPPAGDKTHTRSSRDGFTGMEAIWNYFYWQTLSSNPLDDIGHVLRLSVLVNECTPYSVKPSKELLAECNQFLGPTQPGVTTPDPTEGGAAAASAAAPASEDSAAAPAAADKSAPAPASTGPAGAPAPDDGTSPMKSAETALDFLLGE